MSTAEEFRSRIIARNPAFQYLPASDRYLSAIPQPQYRFNVIGTGINGQEHIRVTLLEGRAMINGVYDPNPGSVEGARRSFAMFAPQGQLQVYDSLEAACNDPAVDGLIISTPNYTHINVLRTAIRSGKHILMEKPMATTIADAHEIVLMAQEYSAVFQIGLQYRYKAIYVEAIEEALQRKAIGEIKTISILEHRLPFLDKVGQWNKFSKYSGGTLVEKCCHYFDLMNLFSGSRPASVFATGSMAVNYLDFEYQGQKADILDNAFVTVTFENGVRANFNLCMFAPMFYEELILCGSQGRLKAFENQDFLPTPPRAQTGLEINRGELQPTRVSTPTYPKFIDDAGHNGATFYEHMYFIDNIEGKPTNTARVEDGFWSVVIGAAAEESVKTGQPVEIAALLKREGIDR